MGIRHAKEVLLMGELMTAERAERIGLVNELCEPGQLKTRVREWSRKLRGFFMPVGVVFRLGAGWYVVLALCV